MRALHSRTSIIFPGGNTGAVLVYITDSIAYSAAVSLGVPHTAVSTAYSTVYSTA